VARGDIFPLNAAREPFFVKMWPAYETEFETPGLEREVIERERERKKEKQKLLICSFEVIAKNI